MEYKAPGGLALRWFIHSVDGLSLKDRKTLFRFDQLTTIQPKEKLSLESKDGPMTTRVLDLFCP